MYCSLCWLYGELCVCFQRRMNDDLCAVVCVG